ELVALIGEAMLRDVVAFQRRAMLEHVARPIAINISSREFGSPALAFEIGQKVAQAGIPPNLVSLEITEGAVTGEGNQYALLNVLRSAGFKVAIDDFGVAQSSLSRLREIPQDEVKVDKAFVDNVPENEIDSNILRAIVSLGAATGSHVVIEGVERQEQLDFLRTLDPVAVQGYVYSPAVPADDFLHMLKEQPWRSVD
ncbi:MAG: EAL domain-containing protein, partial [Candidatus Nanopelagicales bacterium]